MQRSITPFSLSFQMVPKKKETSDRIWMSGSPIPAPGFAFCLTILEARALEPGL
jgi:hypothetical protein